MNIQTYTQPAKLERYSFLWSEVRLIIAAIALFIGGIPPVLALFSSVGGLYGFLLFLHKIAWIISGAASAYMLYRWNQNGRKLFGAKVRSDVIAFFVSVISGINLGLAGLLSRNIGMSISSSRLIFTVVGLLYLISAVYLWRRWKQHGEKIY